MTQEQIEKEFKKIKRLICCSAATPLRFGVLGEDDTGIEARAFTTNDDFQLLLDGVDGTKNIFLRNSYGVGSQFSEVSLQSSSFIARGQESVTGTGQFSLSNLTMSMSSDNQAFYQAENGYLMLQLGWQDKLFQIGDVDANYNGTKITIDDANLIVAVTNIPLEIPSSDADRLLFQSDGDTQIKATTISDLLGYKVYTALLTQRGTAAPTAVILKNTLGGIPTWTREGLGKYRATLANTFNVSKTAVLITASTENLQTDEVAIGVARFDYGTNDDYIEIVTGDPSFWGQVDNALSKTTIEIRVYN